MDSEVIKLIQQAVRDEVAAAGWIVIVASIIGAGIGAFVGSYLKKKGEQLATKEDFNELLKQQKAQTEVTEKIKGEVQQQIALFTSKLEKEREVYLEQLRSHLREREARFSIFNTKQVEVLAELYRRAVRASEISFSLATKIEPSEIKPLDANLSQKAKDAINALDDYFEENLIYIPNELHTTFKRVIHGMLETKAAAEGWYFKDQNAFAYKEELDEFLTEIREQVRKLIKGETKEQE